MALEIEKRYLLAGLPPGIESTGWRTVRQGYLAIDTTNEVRLREVDGHCSLTVKNGSGLAREEVELAISQAHFTQLWPLTAGRQLEKRRITLPWSSGTLFIDEYLSPVTFWLAEVEFDSLEAAENFVPPVFVGPDVTEIATMRTLPSLIARLKRWQTTGE